jgi:hypothetical protein
MLCSVNTMENLPLKSNIFSRLVYVLCLVIALVVVRTGYAQDIDFGSFLSSSVNVMAERDLEFGNIIKPGSESISLGSGLEAVVSLEGIRYMDAFVTISPHPVEYLYLDGITSCASSTCRMAFDMSTAYTNAGQAMDITSGSVTFTGSTVRFPFRARGSGPPGPPPVPPHAGYTPPTSVAYLYLYGTVTATVDNQSGSYSNIITISVAYD